jgi:hypothetical protein
VAEIPGCTCGAVLERGAWRANCPAAAEHERRRDEMHRQPPLSGLHVVADWLREHLPHAVGRPLERMEPQTDGRGFTWRCRACLASVTSSGQKEEEMQRASGDCACELCGLPYHRHPHSYHGAEEPYLVRLCDGRLVHL